MSRIPGTSVEEMDLVRYVDEELSPERRQAVDQHLRERPDDAERVARDIALIADLRRAFDGLARNRPERNMARRTTGLRPLALAASLVAATFLGAGLGWGLKPRAGPAPTEDLLADAVAAHRTFVVEVAHPVEVEATEKGHLATWLSNRLGRQFKVPDLRAAGLSLMGGRLLPSVTEPAAQLMYEDSTGARLTLYLRRGAPGDPSFRFSQGATEQAFYWSDTEFGYALTGSLSRERLLEIAHLLQAQLEESDTAL